MPSALARQEQPRKLRIADGTAVVHRFGAASMKTLYVRHLEVVVQFLKFGTVGALGFVIDTAFVYFGIYALGLSRILAGLFSFPFAVTFTWFGNRIFTFAHAPKERALSQWARFSVVCAIGIVFNRGTYSLLVSTVPLAYQYPVIGLIAGTAAGMFFNFYAARRLAFG
jgi:putative flippase GtrA